MTAAGPRRGGGGAARRVLDGFEARTGLFGGVRTLLSTEVAGGARFAYALGGVLVFLFVIEAITGVAMAAVYTPSVAGAWGSLHYLEHQVVLGSLVRGIHYFASSAFIVVVVLHMTQALLYGAHRRPREATWIVGVVLLLALLGFGITGRFLRMDQHGYWDTRVATGVMGSAQAPGTPAAPGTPVAPQAPNRPVAYTTPSSGSRTSWAKTYDVRPIRSSHVSTATGSGRW